MTNHEILNNGPEGWTHVEYCEGLHTYLLVNGYGWHEWENEDWIFIPNSINDFAHIRSRADIERIKELEDERKWVSVRDRLPEPEVPVLGIVNGFDGILTLVRRWEICDPYSESSYKDFLYWDWIDDEGQDFEELVTHWMPLPELPKGDV